MTGRLPRGVMWDVKTLSYLKKRPNRPFALFLAGWAALQMGDTAGAGNCFDNAINIDSDYTPAHIGKICLDVQKGRCHKAALTLYGCSGKPDFTKKITLFRLCGAISLCALPLIKGAGGGADVKRGFISPARHAVADILKRKPWIKAPPACGELFTQSINLIRYVELLGRGPVYGAGKSARERKSLARGICVLPGLPDEFRVFAAADAGCDLGDLDFTFDAPAILPNALLNRILREKILIGKLREPRVILSNMRRDSASRGIYNVNKWLFIKLSHSMRRGGAVVTDTARELESEGWWADPLIRAYLHT